MSSYKHRKLDFVLTRESGTFTEGGGDTVTLSGLRASVRVEKLGNVGWGQMQCSIFGLTPSMMNDLSTLGMLVMQARRNTISVLAGDDDAGMSMVFDGTIFEALADFESAPSVSFNFSAQTGLTAGIKPVSPSSYKGSVDVVTIISDLASTMGFGFQNHGVSGAILSNAYLSGTAACMAREAAQNADINLIFDDKTIHIWPKGGVRKGPIPLISPETGLVGYPKYTANGLDIRTLYNPAIEFGGQVQVGSSLPQAKGTWMVYGLTHHLEAQTPGGDWFSYVRLGMVGVPVLA